VNYDGSRNENILKQQIESFLKSAFDLLAFAAPIICLFDCIVLPIISAFLPFLGWHGLVHGVGDQFLTILIFALLLPVIVPNVAKHRNPRVVFLYVSAGCLMLFTNLLDERLDSALHLCLTVLASGLLISANWLNKKLVSCACAHHNLEKK
jgi:hypothetical protein